jgi:hypothetical protein
MFARQIAIQIQPGKMDKAIRIDPDAVIPASREQQVPGHAASTSAVRTTARCTLKACNAAAILPRLGLVQAGAENRPGGEQ